MTGTNASSVPSRGGTALAVGWLRRNLYTLLGLAISAIAIWQLVSQVDLASVVEVLAASNWGLVALCILSIPLSMAFKAIRWRYLFVNHQAVSFEPLLSALYVGYLVNTVLPGRVGEFVRAFLIGQQTPVSTPAALATIVLEKVLDLVALAVLLAIVFQYLTLPDTLQLGASSFLLLLGLGLVGLTVVVAAPGPVLRLIDWVVSLVPIFERLGLGKLAHSFLEAFAVLRCAGRLPGLLFWSVMVWVGAVATMWAGLAGVGLDVGMPIVLLVLVATSIGMTAPSAPGYVGVFHYIMVQALLPFGVAVEHATGAAFLVHVVIFGNFVIGGVWFVWRSGYSLNRLRQASGH